MKVADYFAEFSLKIDKTSVAKADATIDKLNAKITKLGINAEKGISLKISAFDVNQKSLNVAIGNALDIASARNVLDISRFHIDQSHLNAALVAAMREATMVAFRSSTLRPNVRVNPITGVNEGGIRPRHVAAAGGIAGGLSRLYGPALALGFGGYGLSQLNQRNQQVVSAQLQSSAVVQQAGGTAEQGADSFQYLRKEGQRIGFNYLDASGDYNKLISGLTGSGVGLKESQKVFSGFAELARVNKLDKTTQNRLFRALSQVAGKGKLQSEELKIRLAA
jgi:hypothetical protein